MHPLDNVIWQALTTSQKHLAESHGCASRFQEEVSVLGGFSGSGSEGYDDLASLLRPGERVGLFLQEPPEPQAGWTVVSSVPLLQMVGEKGEARLPESDQPLFVALGAQDVPEMVALTELTKPGPFGKRTREMGDYFGIRVKEKLIAMAGERLRIPGYTEISAVCTHPEHLGRGHATVLIKMLTERIRRRGEIPFLHVRPENARAVELYERLGFKKRLLRQYAILQKDAR